MSLFLLSPSSRRAWIEIRHYHQGKRRELVALLAEGVDRNQNYGILADAVGDVALLAEGVDRNVDCYSVSSAYGYVALLAEGVDRNR